MSAFAGLRALLVSVGLMLGVSSAQALTFTFNATQTYEIENPVAFADSLLWITEDRNFTIAITPITPAGVGSTHYLSGYGFNMLAEQFTDGLVQSISYETSQGGGISYGEAHMFFGAINTWGVGAEEFINTPPDLIGYSVQSIALRINDWHQVNDTQSFFDLSLIVEATPTPDTGGAATLLGLALLGLCGVRRLHGKRT